MWYKLLFSVLNVGRFSLSVLGAVQYDNNAVMADTGDLAI